MSNELDREIEIKQLLVRDLSTRLVSAKEDLTKLLEDRAYRDYGVRPGVLVEGVSNSTSKYPKVFKVNRVVVDILGAKPIVYACCRKRDETYSINAVKLTDWHLLGKDRLS